MTALPEGLPRSRAATPSLRTSGLLKLAHSHTAGVCLGHRPRLYSPSIPVLGLPIEERICIGARHLPAFPQPNPGHSDAGTITSRAHPERIGPVLCSIQGDRGPHLRRFSCSGVSRGPDFLEPSAARDPPRSGATFDQTIDPTKRIKHDDLNISVDTQRQEQSFARLPSGRATCTRKPQPGKRADPAKTNATRRPHRKSTPRIVWSTP
jgi:hypothetical protein